MAIVLWCWWICMARYGSKGSSIISTAPKSNSIWPPFELGFTSSSFKPAPRLGWWKCFRSIRKNIPSSMFPQPLSGWTKIQHYIEPLQGSDTLFITHHQFHWWLFTFNSFRVEIILIFWGTDSMVYFPQPRSGWIWITRNSDIPQPWRGWMLLMHKV